MEMKRTFVLLSLIAFAVISADVTAKPPPERVGKVLVSKTNQVDYAIANHQNSIFPDAISVLALPVADGANAVPTRCTPATAYRPSASAINLESEARCNAERKARDGLTCSYLHSPTRISV